MNPLQTIIKKDEGHLPFNLAKFFSYISLLLILCSSVILASFIGHTMTNTLIQSQQEYSLILAENINKYIFRKFALPVAYTKGEISLSNPEQYELLDEVIQTQIHGLHLDLVRMYDSEFTVLYSTRPDEQHKTDLNSIGVSRVFEGEEEHHFDLLSGIPYLKAFVTPQLPKGTYLLRTIIPLTIDPDFKSLQLEEGNTPPMGVLEIVLDLTNHYQNTIHTQRLIILGFLLSSLVLFFLIHLIARKAEFILAKRLAHNRELESQLAQSEKLASMGRMVASIAHEIRNPLGIIRSSAEFLIRKQKNEDIMMKTMLTAIFDESCRLGSTVNDFLDYARPRQPRRDDVYIAEIINKALTFLSNELSSKEIAVIKELPDEISIQGDSDLLYRAFYNLLANAIQATEGPGQIRIAAGKKDTEETVLSFSDSGPGFSENALAKALDPFFTTKNTGTGLGLPIVRSIIESHGGTMEIANAEQGGAIITLHFPILKKEKEGN